MNTIPLSGINGFLAAALIAILPWASLGCTRSAEGTYFEEVEPQTEETLNVNLVETRILMKDLGAFEKFERPPVIFDHRQHTEALKDKGCRTCHEADEQGNVTYEFLTWETGIDRESLINAFHEKCLECHAAGAEEVGEAGALGCGECHVETQEYVGLEWYPPTFDHAHHIDAMGKGCDTCHHAYDEEHGRLVYEKGQEIACGECHGEAGEENRESLRKVGHMRCIGCHEKQFEEGRAKLDPYACRECHRPEAEPRRPEAMRFVMRPYEAHPTKLLITYPGSILPPVPFDHETHDPEKDCSKCCHHFHVRTLVGIDSRFEQTGQACRQCHEKAEVSTRAGCIRPDKIYHEAESPNTCVGCHMEENKAENKNAPVSCKECHRGGEAVAQPVAMEIETSSEEGPETYIIARLSRQYMPVKFPHSQHSRMLGSCDTCHHYGPEEQKPTCNTCHGSPGDFSKLTKPRLVSAYHRMCMGCHRNMGIGPITCNKCHEEREVVYSPGQSLRTSMVTNDTLNLKEIERTRAD